MRGRRRRFLEGGVWVPVAAGILAVAILMSAGGDDATGTDPTAGALAGIYRHSALTIAGEDRRSVATIAPRGEGYSVAWVEDHGNLFGGLGVSLDGVFGAAYTEALDGSYRGSGVLAYRIKDGELEGVRLPAGTDGRLVHETLRGPATLEGRYTIVRSVDAGGATHHAGFVEIAHRGDTYRMTWYTPTHSFDGVGVRVGDVLVAGYARGFAPSVIAYCVDDGLLTGIAAYGDIGVIVPDSMTRSGTTTHMKATARCRSAIDNWNPSLLR